MSTDNDFKPYIPASKITPEITFTSILTGICLAVIFGAANAYLGLRVGMTVSASIPASVISMGIIRMLLRRNSILESNIVQTIGSAGESLAAGSIFTLPTLFLWAAEGKSAPPSILEITLISVLGGFLGVFFMIPLRNALIVKEHTSLPYPEGTACAEVLLAGEGGKNKASTVFIGMGTASFFNFIIDGLKLAANELTVTFKGFAGTIGTRIYPAVLSVGYICGYKISSYMLAGGILSWLILIPLIVTFGKNNTLYPSALSIGALYESGGASAIWEHYIKYIGAGALAAGGILSLIKTLPLISKTFSGKLKSIFNSTHKNIRTEQDINILPVISCIIIITLLTGFIPSIHVSFLGAVFIVIFGFLFAAVSSRMVGLVGSSNNPISGMSIAALLITSVLFKLTGGKGIDSMQKAIVLTSFICIICAVAGDTSQDLKTGFILGATPKKQQICELIGVFFSALTIGITLNLLNKAWGFGSSQISAPQATLMKLIAEGVTDGNLPWNLVLIGVFAALFIELLKIPVLPFAIGLYLPIQLTACIMIGGITRLIIEKHGKNDTEKKLFINNGLLFSSGLIAGEGLMGLILALFAILGFESILDISAYAFPYSREAAAIIILLMTLILMFRFSLSSGGKRHEK